MDTSKQALHTVKNKSFVSPDAQFIKDLKSKYPDDRFEVTTDRGLDIFNCLDCQEKELALTVPKIKHHLDSGGHKSSVARQQGNFKKKKKKKKS